jgi:hypothetical protein
MNHIWHQQCYQNPHQQPHQSLQNQREHQQKKDDGQLAERESWRKTLLMHGRTAGLIALRAMFHGL